MRNLTKIRRYAKLFAMGFVALCASWSVVFLIEVESVRVVVAAMASAGVAYFSTLPSE